MISSLTATQHYKGHTLQKHKIQLDTLFKKSYKWLLDIESPFLFLSLHAFWRSDHSLSLEEFLHLVSFHYFPKKYTRIHHNTRLYRKIADLHTKEKNVN